LQKKRQAFSKRDQKASKKSTKCDKKHEEKKETAKKYARKEKKILFEKVKKIKKSTLNFLINHETFFEFF
jgi:hypothetical protein